MKQHVLALLILGVPCLVQAGGVYKCNIKGSTVYQAKPCPSGTADMKFQREQRPQYYSAPAPAAAKAKAENTAPSAMPDIEAVKNKVQEIVQEANKQAAER